MVVMAYNLVVLFERFLGWMDCYAVQGRNCGDVAQICNLPYRRVAIGRLPKARHLRIYCLHPQNRILRDSRLQICATIRYRICAAMLRDAVERVPTGGW